MYVVLRYAACEQVACSTAEKMQLEAAQGQCHGGGRWGMIWENGIKTCIISYKKRIASPGLMQDRMLGADALG